MKTFLLIALVLPLCYAGTLVGVPQVGDSRQPQQQQQHVVHQVQLAGKPYGEQEQQQQQHYVEHQQQAPVHHHHPQQQQQHLYVQQQKPNWQEYQAPNADKGVVTHVTVHRTPTRSMPVGAPVVDSPAYQAQKPHIGVQIVPEHQQLGVHVSHLAGNEQGVEHVSHQYVNPLPISAVHAHQVNEGEQSYQVPEHYYPQQASGLVAVQYVPQQVSQPSYESQHAQHVHLVTLPVVQIPNHQVKHGEQVPQHVPHVQQVQQSQHAVSGHEQQHHHHHQQQQPNVVSHIVVPLSGQSGVYGLHAEPVGHHAQGYPSHVAFGGQQYPQGAPQVSHAQPQSGHYVVQHPVGVPADVGRKAVEEQQKPIGGSQEQVYESQEQYVAGHGHGGHVSEAVYVPQVPQVVSHVAILGHITSASAPHYQQIHQQQQQQHQQQQQYEHHHQQQQATHAPHIHQEQQNKQN